MVPSVEALFEAGYLSRIFFEITGAFFGLQGVDCHVSYSDGASIDGDKVLEADEGGEFEFGFCWLGFGGTSGKIGRQHGAGEEGK